MERKVRHPHAGRNQIFHQRAKEKKGTDFAPSPNSNEMHFTRREQKRIIAFTGYFTGRHYTGKLKYIAKIKQKCKCHLLEARKNNASLSCLETKKLDIIAGADNRIHVDTAPIHWPAPFFLDLELR